MICIGDRIWPTLTRTGNFICSTQRLSSTTPQTALMSLSLIKIVYTCNMEQLMETKQSVITNHCLLVICGLHHNFTWAAGWRSLLVISLRFIWFTVSIIAVYNGIPGKEKTIQVSPQQCSLTILEKRINECQ